MVPADQCFRADDGVVLVRPEQDDAALTKPRITELFDPQA